MSHAAVSEQHQLVIVSSAQLSSAQPITAAALEAEGQTGSHQVQISELHSSARLRFEQGLREEQLLT
jgi:hypothetical protein